MAFTGFLVGGGHGENRDIVSDGVFERFVAGGEVADAGVIGPDMSLGVDDERLAFFNIIIHSVVELFFFCSGFAEGEAADSGQGPADAGEFQIDGRNDCPNPTASDEGRAEDIVIRIRMICVNDAFFTFRLF